MHSTAFPCAKMEVDIIQYYAINEELARRAKGMISFPAVTAGSIAARIYDLGRQCIPEDFADEASREGTVAVFARMLQKGGTGGAREIALAVSGIAMDGNEAVQAEANAIIQDIAAYGLKEEAPEKVRRKSSKER